MLTKYVPLIEAIAQSWHNSTTPFLTYSQIGEQTKYNVVAHSFIIPSNPDPDPVTIKSIVEQCLLRRLQQRSMRF